MNNFINLFSQEVVATIEGLMGATPDLGQGKESSLHDANITPPYVFISIEAKGDFGADLGMLMPIDLATALADTMVGGEGESKESVDDDDLDAIKEINSNIFGALSTSLNSQKKLPKLSFSCKNVASITNEQDLSDFARVYDFAFSLNRIKSHFLLLCTKEFEENFSGKKEEASSPQTEEIDSAPGQNLSQEEMKNIGMLLDVKLNVKVRIGQKRMLLKDVTSMDIGSVIELNQLANEPLEILIDDKVIAKGEVVIVDGNFGIQVTEIGTKRQRLEQLRS
ncbi:flagellar motor switch protein FliY [Helicobacter mustelae]|uniref:Flagellar motor switch protein FliN n=1 Tax=Helicobacter mustelae (strain ATCC 43772 / CCUG 25715 / CIP 103759 / LMG 18044 / NCTC 12198 / R85-136P) TaxID=679897 RepID=D3UJ55_HELM1|nr:flagellar motor switch protein FliY [Helicobacter mustelae]CBG40530.1 putative flagellar motor switch protein [Helicobacter mustelae 12198]SQH72028.1 flagellar motor switch protein [Helicobacter mustelae]STP13171.1 flagellar motor switch protein [Helicobacter mustelae]